MENRERAVAEQCALTHAHNKVIQRVRVIYGPSLFYINKMIIFELVLSERSHTHLHIFNVINYFYFISINS